MRAKDWKMYVCLIVFSLFMFPGIYAAQEGNGKTACESVRKARSETSINGEKAWEPTGMGVIRQIMRYNGQVMLAKTKFKEGAIGTPCTHYRIQTTYVASGKLGFTVGNEKKIMKAGDGICTESDILHSCVCLEPGISIDCFASTGADFLK